MCMHGTQVQMHPTHEADLPNAAAPFVRTSRLCLPFHHATGKMYCDAGLGRFKDWTPRPCRHNIMFRARLGVGRLLRWRLLPWYTLFWLGMGAPKPHQARLHFRCPPDLRRVNSCNSFRASLWRLLYCFPPGPAQTQPPMLAQPSV